MGRTVPPGATPGPEVGAKVQVRLTPSGAVRLEEETGRTDRVLEGRLQEDVRDAVVLAVESQQEGMEITSRGLREVVVIPRADVGELQVMELSVGRTGLLAAGAAVGAYLLARVVFGLADDETLSPPGEPPPVVPLVRVLVPFLN